MPLDCALGLRRLGDYRELKSRYPYWLMLFDFPAGLGGGVLVALSPDLGTTMLVVEDPKTPADDVVRGIDLLEGVALTGIVPNKSTKEIDQGCDYHDYKI